MIWFRDIDISLVENPVQPECQRIANVRVDILAPLYWWQEFNRYEVGSVLDFDSIEHDICTRQFCLDDFSHEHLVDDQPIPTRVYSSRAMMLATVENLNMFRELYLRTDDERWLKQVMQLLPSSYNKSRRVLLNNDDLSFNCLNSKLYAMDEWDDFRKWVETLPIIALEEKKMKEV